MRNAATTSDGSPRRYTSDAGNACSALSCATLFAAFALTAAAAYPEKPVTIVKRAPAGGYTGFEAVANTSRQSTRFLTQELARWKRVIETGRITTE